MWVTPICVLVVVCDRKDIVFQPGFYISVLQRYYQKAKIFQEMGHVDESLQVFLQCLALDENFHQAKREVELVRYHFSVNINIEY